RNVGECIQIKREETGLPVFVVFCFGGCKTPHRFKEVFLLRLLRRYKGVVTSRESHNTPAAPAVDMHDITPPLPLSSACCPRSPASGSSCSISMALVSVEIAGSPGDGSCDAPVKVTLLSSAVKQLR
uniref:Uncharacterized protein n=1 Tax=Gasterosteus aculeatus TaxID=69293 RepID=G3NJM0_GASAC